MTQQSTNLIGGMTVVNREVGHFASPSRIYKTGCFADSTNPTLRLKDSIIGLQCNTIMLSEVSVFEHERVSFVGFSSVFPILFPVILFVFGLRRNCLCSVGTVIRLHSGLNPFLIPEVINPSPCPYLVSVHSVIKLLTDALVAIICSHQLIGNE